MVGPVKCTTNCLPSWYASDNSGSFDLLIPLLPKHISYLAIDLPVNGHSSHKPQGFVYGDRIDLYTCNQIFRKYFKWDKVLLMGHSVSSVLSFIYAATFPD